MTELTYIEFFETLSIENICTSLLKPPDRIVFLGYEKSKMKRYAKLYQQLLFDRGVKGVEFIIRDIEKGKFGAKSGPAGEMAGILNALELIVEQYDDCVIDLTGGRDLFLVAAGILFERLKHQNKPVQMHRVKVDNGEIVDCDMDGRTIDSQNRPMLSVKENIAIYGGKAVNASVDSSESCYWKVDRELKADVRKLWRICASNSDVWNCQCSILAYAVSLNEEEGLSLFISAENLKAFRQKNGFTVNAAFFESLQSAGVLREVYFRDGDLSLTFKNEQIKRCLVKAGTVLEMAVYVTALDQKDEKGAKVYNDVLCGVKIDWDGEIRGNDSENEVDVVMMHGMIPVFVSCKNGKCDVSELYKLYAVAEHFGGRYAKKALVMTKSEGYVYPAIRDRAKELGIKLIEDAENMSEEEFDANIRKAFNFA